MKIKCEHPVIIKNPKLEKFILSGGNLVRYTGNDFDLLIDSYYYLTSKDVQNVLNLGYFNNPLLHNLRKYWLIGDTSIKDLPVSCEVPPKEYSHLYEKVQLVNMDNYDKFEVVDEKTGEVLPFYILVKCGKCILCKDCVKTSYQYRCSMQSLEYKHNPFFVTLTFDKFHLPEEPENLRLQTDIIQRFLKRLRINLQRKGYNSELKYFITYEYGGSFGRLHAHGLFFIDDDELYKMAKNWHYGIDRDTFYYVFQFTNILRYSWCNGNVECEVAKDVSGRYAMKYMNKSYLDKCKSLHSVNLGKAEIMRHVEEIRKAPEKSTFKFLSKSGQIVECPITSYVLDLAYPSVARSLPKQLRDKLFDCVVMFNKLEYQKSVFNILGYQWKKSFYRKYGDLLYCLGYKDIKTSDKFIDFGDDFFGYLRNLLYEVGEEIGQYDIEKVLILDDLHSKHVAMTNKIDFDIRHEVAEKVYKYSQQKQKERDGQ